MELTIHVVGSGHLIFPCLKKASFNFLLTIKANDVLEVILFLSLQQSERSRTSNNLLTGDIDENFLLAKSSMLDSNAFIIIGLSFNSSRRAQYLRTDGKPLMCKGSDLTK